jgi:hypothetical protein
LPKGFNFGIECTAEELSEEYYRDYGILSWEMMYRYTDDYRNLKLKKLRPLTLPDIGSLVVENLRYDGVISLAEVARDPVNNQPNGVYIMLTRGISYKKPNSYGMSFYLRLRVERALAT